MNNKFNLIREENVFIAKRNIVDYIWKSANLEGIGVTYPQTHVIYDGGTSWQPQIPIKKQIKE